MSSKKGKQKSSPAVVSRPSTTVSQNAWSHDGQFFASLTAAVDSHTVRIYNESRCIGRWASTLGGKVQSLLWLELPGSESSKRGKKRRKVSEEATEADEQGSAPQTVLALGLDDGQILILHPTMSSVLYKLEDPSGVASSVSALACPFRKEGSTLLWTADDTGVIRAFSLGRSSGALFGRMSGAGPGYGSALAVRYTSASSAQVLVSRFEICSFDVSLESSTSLDLAQTATFTAAGHNSEIAALTWLDGAGAFASTAHGDRGVDFWRPDGRLASLTTLEDPPIATDVRDGLVSFVTEQGMVAILSTPKEIASGDKEEAVTAKKTSCCIYPGVRAAKLEGDGRMIRIARGNVLKPLFESVTFRDASGSFSREVQLAPPTAGPLVDEDGDVDMGAPVTRAAYKDGTSTVRSATTAQAQEASAINEGELDVDTAGPTLAQRMKSLKIPPILDGAATGEERERMTAVPQATLTQTLIQALHSDDRELIESCLKHTNPKLIRATVKRLPTSLVLPLIDGLVERLSRGKRGYGAGAQRGRALIVWLRTCLVVHVGYLVTVEGLVDRLAGFHAALQHRLEAHNQLLGLAGRLELVVSQIELRREAAGRPRADAAYEAMLANGDAAHARAPLPVHKYVEGESESSSEEDSEDDSEDDAEEWAGMDVDATRDDGEVEDVGFGEDDSESSDSDSGQGKDGFLDLEADGILTGSGSEEGSESAETESEDVSDEE